MTALFVVLGAVLGGVAVALVFVARSRRARGAPGTAERGAAGLGDTAPVGLFRLRWRDGGLLAGNAALARLLGHADTAALRAAFDLRSVWQDPADLARVRAVLAADGGLDGYEVCLRRSDGTPVWLRVSASARRDREGGWVDGAALDVTEERWAREELSRVEQRLRLVAETTQALLFVVSPGDGAVLYANQAARTRLARTAAELLGQPFEDLFVAEDRPALAARRTGTDSEPQTFEARLAGPGRGESWVELTTVLAGLDGRPAWVVTGFDITARRAAERQVRRAEKMAALGVVIAGVAHEINNPNNFIAFNLPVLRDALDELRPVLAAAAVREPRLRLGNLPAERFVDDLLTLVEEMEQGSRRITKIVGELRHYVRSAESEQRRPEQLGVVANRALALLGTQVRRMVTSLDTEVEEGLPAVPMDPGKIEQVIINLVLNGAQAADKVDSRVVVRARRKPGDGQRVLLEVSDNGTGIAPEVLPRIFDPFFTTKGREAGTGLGLGIVERIVEEHGGSVSVETRVGEGSTFTIELPALGAERPTR